LPLPWFRRKRTEEPARETRAPEAPAVDVLTVEEPAEDAGADGDESTTGPATKKRRRGTRGGRNRRKTGTAAAASGTVEADEKPAEKKTPERKPRTQTRRRTPPKRAPLPKAKRELLVSVDAGEKRVAVLEDDKVAEVYLERPERRSIAGNVYLGVVDNVLPGMEAAFVEIGLEKNGFLYVDEIVGPELEGRRGARKIQDLIQRGQTILVQAVKDPMKTKGARLTTEISLPGRFVVFVPHGEGLGVSRRLEEDERNRLRDIVKEIAPKQGGVIVRTAAEGASAEDVRLDLEFLMKLWKQIQARAKESKPPTLVFEEAELPLRVTRDLFTGDFERALVDDDRTLKRIQGYLKKTSPHMAERVSRYRDKVPLFESFGVEAEIRSTLSRRVDLPSGGYLIFDYAEAFTVIDVNTGRFVGSRSKSSGARLEDTVTKNNLEAVKEVVRQLRLRDIGGIIVIDFIDMANPKNREAVEQALQQELERDRTKTYVVEISPLGLVEMTRQNVTDGPREILTRKCPTCAGEGVVVSEATAVVDAERRLRALVASKPRTRAFKVELNAHVADLLIGPGAMRLQEIEASTRRRLFLVGKAGVPHEHFAVLEEGTVEKLAPVDPPVAEGQTVELKLVEVGRHDAGSAVGKLDGISVAVGGAGRLVGKKVSAHVERVLDGVAYATLAGVEAQASVAAPITAEAQAEKPTRASRAKKPEAEAEAASVEVGPEAGLETDADSEPEPEPDEEAEDQAEEQAKGDVSTGAPPKKKTRRGSRGGRGRKKATVPAELNGQPNTPPAELSVPTIHVPSAEVGAVAEVGEDNGAVNGDEAAAPKKKTRRGSRGGRGRKKKPVSQAGAAQTAVDAEPVDTPQPATEPAATDKKPTRRGSRGGRRRRKPAAAASGEATTAGGETAVAESGSDQV
jgi:ribonuclease G